MTLSQWASKAYAFFAVALEDFFLAAFFVAFFAAFFAAFFFAMIQSLLQEKNFGETVSNRWLAHRAKRIGLKSRSHESFPTCQPWQAACCCRVLRLSFVNVAAAISSRTLDIRKNT